jgi:hypothetical protein
MKSLSSCSSFKVNRRFGGTCRPHLQRVEEYAKQETSVKTVAEKLWRRHFPPKHPLTCSGLHGVMCQKIELYITTGVRT